jgi:hypothetical protein
METVLVGLARLARLLQKWGPYFVIELVMPGGTLLALLLYLYQRRNGKVGPSEPEGPMAMMRALFATVQQSTLLLQPSYSRSAQVFRKGARR